MAIKYKELTTILKEEMKKWKKRGIHKLPSEKELCARFGVSRQTVRQSLSLLEKEGLICKKRGSGSYLTGLSSSSEENVIGVLLANDQYYLYPTILHDIESTLTQNGFSVQLFLTNGQISTEREILEGLLVKPLRGLLVEGIKNALPNPNLALYQKLLKNDTDIIFINHAYSELAGYPFLYEDSLQGSQLLVQFLIEKGHKNIGTLFSIDTLEGRERFQGYLEACLSFGLPLSDIQNCWYQEKDMAILRQTNDISMLQSLLQKEFAGCSAIICQNDEISYWLIQAMKLKGLSPKHDIEVVSFDHSYLCHYDGFSIPSLSHASQGHLAAQLMIEKRKGFPVLTQKIPWKLPY